MMTLKQIDKLVKMKDKLSQEEKEELANAIINNEKARKIAITGFISQNEFGKATLLYYMGK